MSTTESYFEDNDELIGGGSDDDSDDNSSTSSSDSSVDGGAVEIDVDDDFEGGEPVDVEEEEDEEEESDEDGESDVDEDADEGGQSGGGYDGQDDNDLDNADVVTKSGKKIKKVRTKIVKKAFEDDLSDNEDEDDDDGEMYLKKFDKEINENYILNNHPECALQNYDEILAMTKVVRDADNIIIDDLHKTNPFLTKYERARILGQRAKQIETGATPFVKVPENIIDGYLIAVMELQQGRIPFIIRRPLPNGGSEYWKVNDLENIAF